MSSTASWRICASVALLGALAGCAASRGNPDFSRALQNGRHWIIEAESRDARIRFTHGKLDIDSPAGVTVWLAHEIRGPVEIRFDATAISEGGANDRVSDLNVFWMATNEDGSAPFTRPRSGKFADYDDLLTYYVGLGGNRNTTSRFRRYVGEPGNRPLLPQHELTDRASLLVPNRKQTITLVANRGRIAYLRDGQTLFAYEDPAPYTRGWFGLRTTWSHLRIENLRVHRP